MKISIDRLRHLAEQKSSSHAALRAAWQKVLDARNEVNRANNKLAEYQVYDGIRRDPKGDAPFEAAVAAASEKLRHAETAHSRLHDEWTLANRLARRGFDFARERTAIPADIMESFE